MWYKKRWEVGDPVSYDIEPESHACMILDMGYTVANNGLKVTTIIVERVRPSIQK